jgi:hypothetical protein
MDSHSPAGSDAGSARRMRWRQHGERTESFSATDGNRFHRFSDRTAGLDSHQLHTVFHGSSQQRPEQCRSGLVFNLSEQKQLRFA